jgi:alcohol dehydrogenase class IV
MAAYFTAPAIAWGPGAIEQLSGLGARRALVVVDPAVARANGHGRIVEELAKSETVLEVVPDLSEPDHLPSVEALRERLRAFAPDWVVAVGGGRTLDGAKAARLGFECPELDLAHPPALLGLPEAPRSRLVAIPTTSGSGAEASWAVDLVAADGTPVELSARGLVPDWALVDARLAETLPPKLLLHGALETVAQATEAYLSAWSNPFSDALAIDAVGTVLRRMPRAVRWSDDPDARSALHYAATAAGLAASNAQRGLAHALARALGGPTGLPYGLLTGLALPAVLEFDRPSARDRIETLEAAVRAPGEPTSPPLATRLRRLFDLLGIPADLAAAGANPERLSAEIPSVVGRALRFPGALANPRVPAPADLEVLVRSLVRRPAG